MDLRDSAPEPSALRKIESSATFEVWQVQSSTMRFDASRKGIVMLTLVGHGYAEFGALCIRHWNEALRRSDRLTLLVDFWDAPGYDSPLRVALTEWTVEHRSQLDTIHVLARSPIVRMGISVANLALGGLVKTYSLRASYDVAVKSILASADPARRR
jgi:hypothetical protein